MASTSLAQQLQKLSAPQTKVYKDTKKQISLLFDPSEAALKDRDTFYEIGVSGLNELIALNPDFAVYQDTLFSLSSKDFERAVQSKEVNQNLDQTIEKFLLQISPYFLLQSSHKAIEWLINRYHIQQYNQDAIMALILPYHGTLIFVRFIQLLEIKHNRWNWLAPIQKNGIPLASQVLHNQCVSNASTLSFIAKMVVKYVKEYKEKATQLNTVFAFFCQVAIGVIDTSKKFAEASITALLPTLMKGIESTIVDFRSSCYIVLGYLFTKTNIKRDTLNQILDKLLTTEFDLSYDVVLLITMMYEHQAHLNRMSDPIFNISVDMMNTICKYLKKFVEVRINIQPFVLAFLREILPHIQSNIGEFKAFSPLPEILINEVDLKNQGPEKIIKCILDAYCPNKEDNSANDSESDIEIIDEDGFSSKILNWYAILLKNFERQYPDAFDKVITAEMSSANEISPKRKGQLSKLLGFKPAIAHKVGGTYLFENLNHVNPDLRIEAVKYIGKEFEALKIQNADFVKESILDRLRDDDPKVVNAALDIEDECLEEVLNEIDLTNAFVNIVSKRTKKWRSTIKRAIIKFCSLDILSVNQDTILVIMPLLFPEDEKTVEVANHIIKSKWGQKFNLTKRLSKKLGKSQNSDELRSNLFKELFIAKSVNFDDLLDENLLDKSNTLDISFYILLKSCSFNKATVEGISSVLNLLLESVENRLIVQHSEDGTFSEAIMPKFIKLAAENKMLFEVIEYIFCRVIEDMNVKDIAKPWCNVLETPETVLIRRLYEICITGCAIPSYGENYVKLLQKLLNKFCSNPKEKFEFIANFACGHILYATDPKDVIAPELQLRSLKLLTNFLAVQENANWIFDSDVVMLVILFNLNNPLIVIRESAIDIMNKILREEPDKKKAMELLNSKIQTTPETFEDVDRELLYSLLPALLDIIKTIENKDETWTEIAAQELELNQQTALLSLKLLTRMLAAENPEPFKDVLGTITNYTCNLNISGNVMASIVLCLAELCSNLKAHALASLRRFMPALIKVLKKQRKAETPELVLLSTVTAIAKIVESLPLFLSPYLQKILYEYSILFAKWQQCDQKCSKVTAIVAKLANIRKKIAESIPPRVLIPVANETHQLLLEKENFDAIGPVMSVLADSFANVTTADFTALQHDLTAFFLTALQLRSDAAEKNIDNLVIDKAEDEVVNALVCLVLKLSETSFRPLYFKIYDWAIRTNVEGYKDRAITFYRLSSAIADRLKGLFVLFAGHFVKNAAELLDACNNSKTEDLYFDNEEKCINLVKYIIKTLHIVFLYDSQSFLNKSRFETLMQPVVDQLENTLGGVGELKGRAAEYLIPCVSQFAVATADDSLWKLLNYQILLKTRHNDAEIRLTALDCLVAMATHLGSSWLPLLAESVPFLAELLEDGDQKIETATKDAIRKLEQILGEPLEKYF
ncbi:hypothetical protein O3G_MSEX011528 [Manduca sexta]|uniref:HEAT repeat-containing protein 1 n=1 Tax=Manduca sexta TaxID=7130 RepID=A0A922CU96_MANSE|nr:hypothetical protein O3G_MSEX011528 [Manduca sexta]